MELWPQSFELLLRDVELPLPSIDMSLEKYAEFCCILLDIPIAENLIESIHMFFVNYDDVCTQVNLFKQWLFQICICESFEKKKSMANLLDTSAL